MSKIVSMILSSSILVLFITLAGYWKKDLFSQQVKYGLLKTALAYSMIPFVCIKEAIVILYELEFRDDFSGSVTIHGASQVVAVAEDGIRANQVYRISHRVLIVWIGIMLLLLICQLYRYRKFQQRILGSAFRISEGTVSRELCRLRRELKIRRTVKLYRIDSKICPFTMGIFNPVIVVPDLQDEKEIERILLHELWHVKQFDTLVKLLGSFMAAIYWFNPLAHILKYSLNQSCELACDEKITKNMSREERREYARMIIEMAAADPVYQKKNLIAFSDSKRRIKDRVDCIMREKTAFRRSAILITMGMVLCSSFPIFACGDVQVVRGRTVPSEMLLPDGPDHFFEMSFEEEGPEETILYDKQFVDEEGEIYPVDGAAAHEECDVHSYVNGTYSEHEKTGAGGCIVKKYSSKRCSKCGGMQIGELISTTKYTACPH